MVWNVIIAKKHRAEQKCVTVFGRKRRIIIYPINTVEGILGRQTDIGKVELENDFTVNY